MAETEALERRHPLAGRSRTAPRVRLTPAGPAVRISLRAPAESVEALSQALGLALPRRPKASARSGERAALWLGPDEWLVIDTGAEAQAAGLSADAGRAGVLCSAVDISHRNTAVLVEGRGAAAAIGAGCPQDLSPEAFPVGACSRTVLGKSEIVLWRTGEEAWRVECWRSFSDYVFTFLAEAIRDPGL